MNSVKHSNIQKYDPKIFFGDFTKDNEKSNLLYVDLDANFQTIPSNIFRLSEKDTLNLNKISVNNLVVKNIISKDLETENKNIIIKGDIQIQKKSKIAYNLTEKIESIKRSLFKLELPNRIV